MNKKDLVEKVHELLGGTKVQAENTVNLVFDSIVAGMKGGDDVSIAGFGIFSAKMRKARKARNPRTGEEVDVPAMRVPKFKASKTLKDMVR
jgi:DNA-binding protein HU-beta